MSRMLLDFWSKNIITTLNHNVKLLFSTQRIIFVCDFYLLYDLAHVFGDIIRISQYSSSKH